MHPATPARAVPTVFVTCMWRNAGEWGLDFMVGAPPAALRVPAAIEYAARRDGLWNSTCFELFVLDPAGGAYLEFNFSPSGEWAAYQFDGYRAGMRDLEVTAPQIFNMDPAYFQVQMARKFRGMGMDEDTIRSMARPPALAARIVPTHLVLNVTLEHPGLWPGKACHVGLSAVIEEADGTKSYWALAHPPGKPDFHHGDGFALEMAPTAARRKPGK